MTKKPPSTGGWMRVCPRLLILPDRYLWLEGGQVNNVGWWRIVITDGSPRARALRTGLTLWETEQRSMPEAAAKQFFGRFEQLLQRCLTRSREAMSVITWKSLHELDHHRVVGGDLNISLSGQLDRLEELSTLDETCIEVVMRMLVYTPSALGERQLETAMKYATDQNKHRL